MPRVNLPATKVSMDGVADPAEQNGDPTNGHSVRNTGLTMIRARNTDAASQTITFVTPGTVAGFAIQDKGPLTIPAGATRTFSGFAPSVFGSALGIDVSSANVKLIALEP